MDECCVCVCVEIEQTCEQLLMSISDDAQPGIHVGDVFALMVSEWLLCVRVGVIA